MKPKYNKEALNAWAHKNNQKFDWLKHFKKKGEPANKEFEKWLKGRS